MSRKSFLQNCWLAVFWAASALESQAQSGEKGAEVAIYGGANGGFFSISEPVVSGLRLAGLRDIVVDESGTKWLAGAGVGAQVHKHLMVVGNFSVNHLGSPTFSVRVPGSVTRQQFTLRARLFEVTFGAQVLLPFGTSKVVPFLGGGIGGAHARFKASSTTSSIPSSAADVMATDLTAHGSFGVRFHITERWGIRPEVQLVRIPDDTYYRACLGLFLRF
ncbi:MAG: outer membrane beta-barrel protein [Acidobacteria bacterium]|nr:outer membrane beta-barrel protein [Acidobacteriota bacterium]MCI0724581.1 outer membrane beta-barrel protein [Acidobacteriota bacterium]